MKGVNLEKVINFFDFFKKKRELYFCMLNVGVFYDSFLRQVLDRCEKIKLLVDKTENLRSHVSKPHTFLYSIDTKTDICLDEVGNMHGTALLLLNVYRTQGTKMKRKMWFDNMKIKLCSY